MELALGGGGRAEEGGAGHEELTEVEVDTEADGDVVGELVGDGGLEVEDGELGLVGEECKGPLLPQSSLRPKGLLTPKPKARAIEAEVGLGVDVGEDGGQVHALTGPGVGVEVPRGEEAGGADADVGAFELGEAGGVVVDGGGVVGLGDEGVGLSGGAVLCMGTSSRRRVRGRRGGTRG